ncbi:uncharacterized protein [Primulina huaijiensis]|uniref:uncharacterized protein n=1 Tax=Primulina huaijiensis TaxID=1492673 RepID=UPI003CC773FB
MSNGPHRRFEDTINIGDIYRCLQELYDLQTRPSRHTVIIELMITHMRYGTSAHKHGVKIIGLIEKIVSMDLVIPNELSSNILLPSLSTSFDGFVKNLNMNKMERSLEELVNMLATYEATIKKENHVFLVGLSPGPKKGSQEKGKRVIILPRKTSPQEANSKDCKRAHQMMIRNMRLRDGETFLKMVN